MIKERLSKKEVLTIPNMLSFFRILLIPLIVILYSVYENYYAAVAVIVLSGLTDVIDGKIARKYNMISDFGKFIDPVADKLTQAAMIFCLATKNIQMLFLIFLMLIKETTLLICGYFVLKKTDTVNSAKWYGKVSTATIYAVMIFLFFFPDINAMVLKICILICSLVLIGSTLGYAGFYYKTIKEIK